jgi:hypothetical protein
VEQWIGFVDEQEKEIENVPLVVRPFLDAVHCNNGAQS